MWHRLQPLILVFADKISRTPAEAGSQREEFQ
jgi:hypothetical protein